MASCINIHTPYDLSYLIAIIASSAIYGESKNKIVLLQSLYEFDHTYGISFAIGPYSSPLTMTYKSPFLPFFVKTIPETVQIGISYR